MQKRSAQIAPFWYIYTVIMYIELYINKYIYIYSICKYVYLRGMGHHESWLLDFRYQRWMNVWDLTQGWAAPALGFEHVETNVVISIAATPSKILSTYLP